MSEPRESEWRESDKRARRDRMGEAEGISPSANGPLDPYCSHHHGHWTGQGLAWYSVQVQYSTVSTLSIGRFHNPGILHLWSAASVIVC